MPMTPRRRTARLGTLALCCALAGHAQANDLFTVNLAETGNPGNSLFVGSSSLPNMLERLADQTGAFQSFNGVPFSASVSYAGVANAISITYDPTGGANGGELLTITDLAGTNATVAFDRANGNLGNQIRDFFLRDDPDTLKRFLREMSRRSLVAVTDGNPLATTARSARYKFERLALHSDWTETENSLYNRFSIDHRAHEAYERAHRAGETPGPDATPLGNLPVHKASTPVRTRFDFVAQAIDADGFQGYSFDLNTSVEYVFTEHISGVFGVPLAYHEVEGADVFNGGFHLDMPVRIVMPEYGRTRGVTWLVTPGASMDWTGSTDFAAGGILWSAGLSSAVIVHLDKLRLVASGQYTLHEGQKLKIDDYEFDPGVSQQILKLGGKAVYSVAQKLDVYAGITYTDFLRDAAVNNYWSPTAGVAFVFRNGATISVGYEGDFADNFERHGGRVGVSLPF